MNTINITGNLTANPEIRVGKNDKKVANFTVAVRGGKDHTDFIRCTAFGQRAEYVEKYATKGARVAIAGSLHTDSYTNKDGNRVNTVEIWVSDVEVSHRASAPATSETASEPAPKYTPASMFVEIEDDDDDLPY